jgi:AcrR family transcriptional regulator
MMASKKDGPSHSRSQLERSTETKRRLVAAARELFARQGFAATTLDDILQVAGVTRGALYHHFEDKTALFRGAFEEQEALLAADIMRAAKTKRRAWPAFMTACEAFLEACLDPAMQRIILVDAPSVIGWEAMRAIEAKYVLTMMLNGLNSAIEQGDLSPRPVAPLAHFLLGALSESAMSIARSPNPEGKMKEVRAELRRILNGITSDHAR